MIKIYETIIAIEAEILKQERHVTSKLKVYFSDKVSCKLL